MGRKWLILPSVFEGRVHPPNTPLYSAARAPPLLYTCYTGEGPRARNPMIARPALHTAYRADPPPKGLARECPPLHNKLWRGGPFLWGNT